MFQQTLKDVEHIYRDIAGFDMSYDEVKGLWREAWKEKQKWFINKLLNRLEDKHGKSCRVCNESNPEYKIFIPQTDPF